MSHPIYQLKEQNEDLITSLRFLRNPKFLQLNSERTIQDHEYESKKCLKVCDPVENKKMDASEFEKCFTSVLDKCQQKWAKVHEFIGQNQYIDYTLNKIREQETKKRNLGLI